MEVSLNILFAPTVQRQKGNSDGRTAALRQNSKFERLICDVRKTLK
jgi:hypothetical protein